MFLSPLSEFVYYRTYSRFNAALGRRETYEETVERLITYLQGKRKGLPKKMWDAVRKNMLEFSVFPSMRLLWSAGPSVEHNHIAAYNCAGIVIDSMYDFSELLYILMHGTGCGFSLERVSSLPVIPEKRDLYRKTCEYVVEDSKEGWKKSVDFVIDCIMNDVDFDIDYSKVRPKGTKLKTFGGTASGPAPLIQVHNFLREVCHKAQGRRLSVSEVHDICCEIASCVVTGGVRRSALISLSTLDDEIHAGLKNGEFPLRRYLANNSAIYDDKPDIITFMREWSNLASSGSGERGIFNRGAARKRLVNRKNIMIPNPCGEIVLRSRQFCNLSTVVVRETDTLEDLAKKVETATWLGTIQASLTDIKEIHEDWKINSEEESLLGVSIAGQMDNPDILDATALRHLHDVAIKTNKKAAKAIGINQATAVTTVKPEGTVSLVANCGAGIHPYWSPYYIRRVRINAHDPLCKVLKCYPGIPMIPEVGQSEDNCTIWVIEFPCKAPTTARFKKDMDAITQLQWYLHVMRNYVDHNASTTVYVKPDEWLKVGAFVYEHFDEIVGVSFLPDDGGIYKLAPIEEISKEEYERRAAEFPQIDYSILKLYEKSDETEGSKTYACTGGGCSL